MTAADAARIRRREDRRLDLLIAEHRYREGVRRELARLSSVPHDSSPTIPPTRADGGAESETS